MPEHVWQVKQGGIIVAKGFAPDRQRAEAEATHYGWQYQMDGPVEVTVRKCPKPKRKNSEAGTSNTPGGDAAPDKKRQDESDEDDELAGGKDKFQGQSSKPDTKPGTIGGERVGIGGRCLSARSWISVRSSAPACQPQRQKAR